DVRRKNFSSVLFQPIPHIYAYETWANLPDHLPAAARKIRDLITDWWQNVPDRREVGYTAIEALLLASLLGAACWRGIRRTRRWARIGGGVSADGGVGKTRPPPRHSGAAPRPQPHWWFSVRCQSSCRSSFCTG